MDLAMHLHAWPMSCRRRLTTGDTINTTLFGRCISVGCFIPSMFAGPPVYQSQRCCSDDVEALFYHGETYLEINIFEPVDSERNCLIGGVELHSHESNGIST